MYVYECMSGSGRVVVVAIYQTLRLLRMSVMRQQRRTCRGAHQKESRGGGVAPLNCSLVRVRFYPFRFSPVFGGGGILAKRVGCVAHIFSGTKMIATRAAHETTRVCRQKKFGGITYSSYLPLDTYFSLSTEK